MKRVCQRSREVLKCEIRRDKREKETLEVVPLMRLIVLCLVCVHLQYHVSFEKTTKKTNLLFRFEENSSRDVLVACSIVCTTHTCVHSTYVHVLHMCACTYMYVCEASCSTSVVQVHVCVHKVRSLCFFTLELFIKIRNVPRGTRVKMRGNVHIFLFIYVCVCVVHTLFYFYRYPGVHSVGLS